MIFKLLIFVLILIQSIKGEISPGNPEIKLETGKVRGQLINFRGSIVYEFLGIPFAEPPINELRFKKPVPVKPWNDVKSMTNWPPHCTQALFPGFNSDYQFSEDCLTLNVITPSALEHGDKRLRPVMVWIHGGGFAIGSAHFDAYNGTILAATEDIVYVAINYRLGALGFLHLPEHGVPSNLGLWDQLLALQWVKNNIKQFGGDPDQVTIFGESAGGISVAALVVSPRAKGLFKNAILQSGSILNIDTWFNPKSSEIIMEKSNCNSAENVFSCLQSANESVFASVNDFLFWPVHGDDFLPEDPNNLIKSIDSSVNILLGTVGNEGASMLTLTDPVTFDAVNPVNLTFVEAKTIIGDIYGDEWIGYIVDKFFDKIDHNDPNQLRLAIGQSLGDITLACPTYMFGRDAVKYSKSNVYAYYQSHKPSKPIFKITPESNWIPATHGDDVPMMFGGPLNDSTYNQEDTILSMVMLDIWGEFARTGKVPKVGSREWLKWTSDESGKVEMPVKELNSRGLSQFSNQIALDCQKNWPFPIKQLNTNFGNKIKPDNHEEL
ncbi:acetylcholinesterase-like [Panonychus citri]|uniref:acetylcholinesterase-like n=1 Tax=Panonychus citri TaxID=50023 RepID=UPI0023073409|nr:acetylcholinesterase-like [Panonychus citri]